MDASSAAACSSSSADEAYPLPSFPISSSLPSSTSPSFFRGRDQPPSVVPTDVAPPSPIASSRSLNLEPSRRQSLGRSEFIVIDETCVVEPELSGSNRSTSSPQLMSVKSRSKVYRRASLKSLSGLAVVSAMPSAQSRIVKLTNGRRPPREQQRSQISVSNDGGDNNKENLALGCDPLSSSSRCYPYSTACEKNGNGEASRQRPVFVDEEKQQQQAKGKSCSSFLPILSLIPHTVISFQYPSPKMKFSWWRNKIS